MERIIINSGGFPVSAAIIAPESPKAVVQLIHGAWEHKDRYLPFMEFLAENGYAAIISDNRGHGSSINDEYEFGHMDGPDKIIGDLYEVTKYAKKRWNCVASYGKNNVPTNEKIPFYLFGHSLGSLFARYYLMEHDNEAEKLILSGTVNYQPASAVGIALGSVIALFSGKHGHSKLIARMGRIQKDDSWICGNREVMEKVHADPLCQNHYTNAANITVWQADYALSQTKKYRCQNPKLKIMSISGEHDPVTGGQRGLADSASRLTRAGYSNITVKVYSNMWHEVLNEQNNDAVLQDILAFYGDEKA